MKRLILLATMVAVLASCEKHEIRNEVLNEIEFTSKFSKLTKALVENPTDNPIMDNSGNVTGYNNNHSTYFQNQPFGVYAYGPNYTEKNANNEDVTNPNEVMGNIEIHFDNTNYVAANGNKYYWPNDANTTLEFYAYSPYLGNNQNTVKNHQKMNGTSISHTKANGLSIVGYEHKNMYVDYMLADAVTGAKYDDGTTNEDGTVNLTFRHKMTQIIFKVKTEKDYDNINFTLKRISLKNVKNLSNIVSGEFQEPTGNGITYNVFPAVDEGEENGAPNQVGTQNNMTLNDTYSLLTDIYPVTMIPQTLASQSIEIEYTISGSGVATETVTRNIELTNTPAWAENKRITYAIIIGLREIKFNPTVGLWGDDDNDGEIEDGEGDIDHGVNIYQ